MSYVLKRLPAEDVYTYFQQLVDECVSYGLFIRRILIWDCQFIHANRNNNRKKDTKKYGDSDARYCRHNRKKKEVGYDPGFINAYCKDWWFSIFFKMFPRNRSYSKAFRETISAFLKTTKYQWDIVIADSGHYSKENLEYIRCKRILLIIRSRKRIKNQPVKELKKGYYFNKKYIPKGWTNEYYLKIYEFRPMIEQGNSYNNTYYYTSRLNTHGIESAIKNRAFIYILELLKALTTYKVGRPDLLMKQTAFENSKQIYWREMIPRLAESNNYKILTNWLKSST
ncbi:transposase [Candidatus Harpocratesius sp.]